ncbi:alanine racemase [Nonlabens xylanidelens]|uniref:Alanine racemase n=1 Tax=Nonlabens xylanidelens TaxID=191564 RepID=A0A2S6IRD4_9FLAO|nr:alanine racemase [Nonlabens xylanidelens]PPK96606.1 alanine racemase [Nonlabens xylanidelens]PQJ13325.1 alanine racemase [Nonlabens xylanidelens]
MQPKGTRLEVNLNALEHNYHYLRSKLDHGTKFISVVKANAYGHGIVEVAQKLQDLGTDYFATAYVEEAVELRNNKIVKPILVLHAQQHNLEICIDRCLEPVIYSVEMLDAFTAFAKAKNQQSYPIHIEFNTGLNRIGIDAVDLDKVLDKIKSSPEIKVRGLQSHLAASEDLDEEAFTNKQILLFEKLADRMQDVLGYEILKHESNTSGILNFKSAHFSMVRSGIGLYGFGNDLKFDKHLKPIGTLISNISQIRTIEAGETVSYNRMFVAKDRTTYAVVAIGHGDGINRIYGYGKLKVQVNGHAAPTLGIICMDMLMIDITGIEASVGDEVVIFDPQVHTSRQMAEDAGTISYELLTGIQKRVKRVYLSN